MATTSEVGNSLDTAQEPVTVATSVSRRPTWLPPVLVAVAILAALVSVLVHRIGPTAADVTEHVPHANVLGPLDEGVFVRQRFTARADDLSRVSVRFGTFGGVSQCVVSVQLVEVGGSTVGDARRPCGDLPDSEVTTAIDVSPQPNSSGRDYELVLSLAEARGESVMVWGGPDASGALPNVQVGEDAGPFPIEIHTAYGESKPAAAFLGRALSNLSEYRPWWGKAPTVVTLAVLMGGALVALTRFRGRKATVLLLVFVVSKGIVWTLVLPPFEGPDEPAHTAYAQFMGEEFRIPRRYHPAFGLPNPYSQQVEAITANFFDATAPPGDRPDYTAAGKAKLDHDLDNASPRANGYMPSSGYSPYYYAPAAVLYRLTPGNLVDRLFVMRWWSVALAAVTGWCALVVGRRVFPRAEGAAIALAVAVTAQPVLTQQTSIINNDAFVIAGGALCTLAAFELIRPYPERRRWMTFLGAAAVGLAVLGKPFGAAFAPVLGLAWLIGWVRTERDERPRFHREVIAGLLGLGVTYGLWTAISVVFDIPSPALSDQTITDGPKTFRAFIHAIKEKNFQSVRSNWIDQLWSGLSWLDTRIPGWMRAAIAAATIVGVVLVAMWCIRALSAGRRIVKLNEWRGLASSEHLVNTALLIAVPVATLCLLYAVAYVSFRTTGRYDLIQGRYVLMAMIGILAAPVLCLTTLRPRVSATVPMVLVAGAVVATNLAALSVLVDRFYL